LAQDGLELSGSAYRCPPESSVNEAFHTVPNRTLTSKPCVISIPSGGCSLEKFPGNNSAKMLPNSLRRPTSTPSAKLGLVRSCLARPTYEFTFSHVFCSASFLYSSRVATVSSIFVLSLSTWRYMPSKSFSFFSTLQTDAAEGSVVGCTGGKG